MPAADDDVLMAPGDDAPFLPVGLTESQQEAVLATDRVLCILAGAGAGKTRVLTLRVARRIHDGSADGNHTLVCTFSRKAADELRRRLWALDVADSVEAGTFHRTALRLLRLQAADRGTAPPVVMADRSAALARLVDPDAEPGRGSGRRGGPAGAAVGDPGRDPRARSAGRRNPSAAQLETEIGWAKARLIAPDAYEVTARSAGRRPAMGAARVAELYDRYEAERRRRGSLDLDDLLWRCADALEEDATFASAVRWRFRHLYVDEMQDVNPAQFRLLLALLGDEPDLCAVGDPNQSVYGWNGADPTLLDRLPTLLPHTRVVRLEENHRCSPQVVAVAAAALGLDAAGESGPGGGGPDATGADPPTAAGPTSSRPDGPLPRVTAHPTDADEAAWVAREVWRAHRPGRRWSQIAVLARTNAQLGAVADALDAEHVPCRRAGGEWGPASDLRTAEDDAPGASNASSGTGAGQDWGPGAPEGDDDAVVLATFHRAKGLQWPAVFVIGLSDGLVPFRLARSPAARAEEQRLLYVAMTRAEDELTCSWAAYPDHRARDTGAAPRQPSPWLRDVVRRRDALAAQRAPTDPDTVSARLADLRARLAADGPGLG
jgi:DNA helicase-2/ATP-dependent DNA helicase PcrA